MRSSSSEEKPSAKTLHVEQKVSLKTWERGQTRMKIPRRIGAMTRQRRAKPEGIMTATWGGVDCRWRC